MRRKWYDFFFFLEVINRGQKFMWGSELCDINLFDCSITSPCFEGDVNSTLKKTKNRPLCKTILYSLSSPESFWKVLIFSVLIYTSHYSVFQRFHEQRETWQVSGRRELEEENKAVPVRLAMIASRPPVKDPVCLPPVSEALPARDGETDGEREERAQRDESTFCSLRQAAEDM